MTDNERFEAWVATLPPHEYIHPRVEQLATQNRRVAFLAGMAAEREKNSQKTTTFETVAALIRARGER